MKSEEERIDSLLDGNAAKELSRVDWDETNRAISSRLDGLSRQGAAGWKYRPVIKIAAGLVMAAGIAFFAYTAGTPGERDLPIARSQKEVEIVIAPRKPIVRVDFTSGRRAGRAVVDISSPARGIGKCEVRIIDLNGGSKEKNTRPSWIIISRPEPAMADNGVSRDDLDLIRML